MEEVLGDVQEEDEPVVLENFYSKSYTYVVMTSGAPSFPYHNIVSSVRTWIAMFSDKIAQPAFRMSETSAAIQHALKYDRFSSLRDHSFTNNLALVLNQPNADGMTQILG